MFFFEKEDLAYVAEENGTYSKDIQRLIEVDEPLFYLRNQKKDGKGHHLFSSAGLFYVYVGSFKNFTKKDPRSWTYENKATS